MFWKSNRNSDRRKVIILTKRVKNLFKLGLFTKPNSHQTKVLTDVGNMTFGMILFLVRDDWKTEKQYFDSINVFLNFENQTFNYNPTLKYKVGHMEKTAQMIYLQHQIRELKKSFNFTED